MNRNQCFSNLSHRFCLDHITIYSCVVHEKGEINTHNENLSFRSWNSIDVYNLVFQAVWHCFWIYFWSTHIIWCPNVSNCWTAEMIQNQAFIASISSTQNTKDYGMCYIGQIEYEVKFWRFLELHVKPKKEKKKNYLCKNVSRNRVY